MKVNFSDEETNNKNKLNLLDRLTMVGISDELRFWKDFVNSEEFNTNWLSNYQKTNQLQTYVHEFIKNLDKSKGFLEVLDVGSGPVSQLIGTIDKEKITTVDPLGALYELIFDYKKNKINPPISFGGEFINFEEKFDIVHISNAIDHSQDPQIVFNKLVRACNPEGYLIVQGFEDEAIEENWEGFHQYNFRYSPKEGKLFYFDKDLKPIILSQQGDLKLSRKLTIPGNHKKWFIFISKKSSLVNDKYIKNINHKLSFSSFNDELNKNLKLKLISLENELLKNQLINNNLQEKVNYLSKEKNLTIEVINIVKKTSVKFEQFKNHFNELIYKNESELLDQNNLFISLFNKFNKIFKEQTLIVNKIQQNEEYFFKRHESENSKFEKLINKNKLLEKENHLLKENEFYLINKIENLNSKISSYYSLIKKQNKEIKKAEILIYKVLNN